VNAAELIGWSNRVGRLAPGYYADIVAVRGDPLANISLLEVNDPSLPPSIFIIT
jgi:imidazolonepropionase-like amidohydrolase